MPLERAASPAAVQWNCPTCNTALESPFCPTCGERLPNPRDLTLHGFLETVAKGITNIDGRLIRSFRGLITRPGELTVAFLRGQRRLYNPPLQLFLLANVLFFAVHAFTKTRALAATLDSHMHTQPWSELMTPVILRRLAAAHMTLEAYAPVFDNAVALHAKSLIVLMAFPLALLTPIIFRRSKQPFVAHVVFSVHFFAFLLLLLCAFLLIIGADESLGGAGLTDTVDHIGSVLLVIACAVYLFYAIRRVFCVRGSRQFFAALALTVIVTATFLGYRFALLLITLYST